jgi:hypothetical protein
LLNASPTTREADNAQRMPDSPPRKRGRPRSPVPHERFSVYLPTSTIDYLHTRAKAQRTTGSEFARRLLTQLVADRARRRSGQ